MLALIFPGQGSQFCGMGKDVAEAFPESRLVFEEADEALGFLISRLCFEGPEEQLRLTENTQPAILTVSVALYRLLEKAGRTPAFVAGHSLGEYSALVAAGAISFADAVRVAAARLLHGGGGPVGVGAMAAVIGLRRPQIDEICRLAAQASGDRSEYQRADQLVISGDKAAVERASEAARQRGAKRVIPLPVSAPFHCALMKPAEERLAVELDRISFSDLRFPLVNNVDAAVICG
jgi:[acyl-carrier-protein] S-malonyltransferase